MKAFEEMTIEEKNIYIYECYQKLTPKNKDLFVLKYMELLVEQEREEKAKGGIL